MEYDEEALDGPRRMFSAGGGAPPRAPIVSESIVERLAPPATRGSPECLSLALGEPGL